MPLLPSPPFNRLCAKVERAFQEVIVNNQVIIPKAAITRGQSSDEKTAPRVEISARGGPEDPPRSGNYHVHVSITVFSSADIDADQLPIEHPSAEDLHEINVGTVLDVLASPNLKDWLNRAVADFFVFELLSDSDLDHTVEGRLFSDSIGFNVYCCAAAIIPEVPLVEAPEPG